MLVSIVCCTFLTFVGWEVMELYRTQRDDKAYPADSVYGLVQGNPEKYMSALICVEF